MNKRTILALLAASGLMACLSFAQEIDQLDGQSLGNCEASWRWCSKCDGMHLISGGIGPCRAGGDHWVGGSGSYVLVKNDPKAQGMDGWHCCSKCRGLFHHFLDAGVCPTGGAHDSTGGGDYCLVYNVQAEVGQSGWRYCVNCHGFFFGGSAPHGTCPAGGQHQTGSFESFDFLPFRESDLPILWGKVSDSTPNPVANAQVQATRGGTTLKTKTKADGTYCFTKVGLGKATVKATKKKVGEATGTIRIKSGNAKSVNLELEK